MCTACCTAEKNLQQVNSLGGDLRVGGLLCEFAERRKFYTEYVHFWSLEYGVFHGIRGIRVEYGRIQASGRSFGIELYVENVFTQ